MSTKGERVLSTYNMPVVYLPSSGSGPNSCGIVTSQRGPGKDLRHTSIVMVGAHNLAGEQGVEESTAGLAAGLMERAVQGAMA